VTSQRINLICHFGATSGPELAHHYLDHYHRLGVDRFLFIVHGDGGDQRTRDVLGALAAYGVQPVLTVDSFSVKLKLDRYNAVLNEQCGDAEWVIYADADELHVYPAALHEFAAALEQRGEAYATGAFHDRTAQGGELAPIRAAPSIWEQFPYVLPVTESITGGWTRKVCLVRAGWRLAEGGAHALSFGAGAVADYARTHADQRTKQVEIHHFKWDQGLLFRLGNKLSGSSGDLDRVHGPEFMDEYERLATHLERQSRLALDGARWVGTPPIRYERGAGPGGAAGAVSSSGRLSRGPRPRWRS
jgi:hypothetical protein